MILVAQIVNYHSVQIYGHDFLIANALSTVRMRGRLRSFIFTSFSWVSLGKVNRKTCVSKNGFASKQFLAIGTHPIATQCTEKNVLTD